ncbi:MAG: hypothetical protein HXS51_08995 [Theionarchaea archaeon]|nr:hypothetical protein [Theionarchaea archaeon]
MRNQFNHLSRFIDYHEIRSFWNYFVIICEILEVFERSISEEDFTFIEKSMKLADEYNRMIMEYSGSSILKSLSRDVQENVYARVQKAIAAISPPDLVAYEESEFLTIENNGKGAAVNVQLSWFEVNHGDSISITRILPEERYRIYCPAQKIREVLWQDWNEKRYKLVIKGWRRGK